MVLFYGITREYFTIIYYFFENKFWILYNNNNYKTKIIESSILWPYSTLIFGSFPWYATNFTVLCCPNLVEWCVMWHLDRYQQNDDVTGELTISLSFGGWGVPFSRKAPHLRRWVESAAGVNRAVPIHSMNSVTKNVFTI